MTPHRPLTALPVMPPQQHGRTRDSDVDGAETSSDDGSFCTARDDLVFEEATEQPVATSTRDEYPWKLTSEAISSCMAIAQGLSGLDISSVPVFHRPANVLDFGACIQTQKVTTFDDYFRRVPASSIQKRSWQHVTQFALAHVNSCLALYLPNAHTVVVHPGVDAERLYLKDFMSTAVIHELVHAAQVKNFPELFTVINDSVQLQEEHVLYSDPAPTSIWGQLSNPRKTLSFLQDRLLEGKLSQRIIEAHAGAPILWEGHARWVEKTAAERIFGIHEEKAVSWRQALFGGPKERMHYFLHRGQKPDRVAKHYDAGYHLIVTVKAAQKKWERGRFFDLQGRLVELAPALRNDGMIRYLYRNPHHVKRLLPDYDASDRPEIFRRVDSAFLDKLFLLHPEHVACAPLFTRMAKLANAHAAAHAAQMSAPVVGKSAACPAEPAQPAGFATNLIQQHTGISLGYEPHVISFPDVNSFCTAWPPKNRRPS